MNYTRTVFRKQKFGKEGKSCNPELYRCECGTPICESATYCKRCERLIEQENLKLVRKSKEKVNKAAVEIAKAGKKFEPLEDEYEYTDHRGRVRSSPGD